MTGQNATITITLDAQGQFQLAGLPADKIVGYGLLQMALQMAVQMYAAAQQDNRIVPAAALPAGL